MTNLQLRLNPALDINSIAQTYQRDGLVQVPGLFEPEVAEAISNLLETNTPWSLTFLGPDRKPRTYPVDSLHAMDQNALRAEITDVIKRAGGDYGFIYLNFGLISAALSGKYNDHVGVRIAEFMNSAEMLDFGRKVTGDAAIRKADAQATLFRPNDFLGLHTDETIDGVDRAAAYTLGFTRRWRSDWGGQLVFHDPANGDIVKGLVPRWNTLTMFKVPRLHSVAPVAPYCQGARVSVVGWFRRDS